MKAIIKKNQVIITALAIMIAIAGYLNFTKDSGEENANENIALENSVGGDIFDLALNEDDSDFDDISDGTYANVQSGLVEGMDVADNGELSGNNGDGAAATDSDTPGEAVLASTPISSGYFSSVKLEREQIRARNKETLMQIVENTEVSDEQKQQALDTIISMTETAELENATEMLLEAKGFDGVVVSIVDGSIDVVVNAETITQQQVAQIEDIVMRKAGVTADSIVISAVVSED